MSQPDDEIIVERKYKRLYLLYDKVSGILVISTPKGIIALDKFYTKKLSKFLGKNKL